MWGREVKDFLQYLLNAHHISELIHSASGPASFIHQLFVEHLLHARHLIGAEAKRQSRDAPWPLKLTVQTSLMMEGPTIYFPQMAQDCQDLWSCSLADSLGNDCADFLNLACPQPDSHTCPSCLPVFPLQEMALSRSRTQARSLGFPSRALFCSILNPPPVQSICSSWGVYFQNHFESIWFSVLSLSHLSPGHQRSHLDTTSAAWLALWLLAPSDHYPHSRQEEAP